jgi:hypothetical protein
MCFADLRGWRALPRLVLWITVAQWMTLGVACAQISATATSLQIVPATGQASSIAPGTAVSLRATVTLGGQPVTRGQVTFCNAVFSYCTDVHRIGTAQLTGNGTAVLRFVPGIGSHSYQAVFAGTTTAASSSSPVAVATVIGTFPTTTNLTMSGVPGNYTLQAGVVSAGGPIAPTGNVEILDTTNGKALLSTPSLVATSTMVNWNSVIEPVSEVFGTIIPGDFNGDGLTDLVYLSGGTNPQLAVLLGNGDGTLAATPKVTSIASGPWSFAVGDFNGDGTLDVAMTFSGSQTTLIVYLGNGDGTFTAGATTSENASVNNVVADFNGDGNEDIAAANAGQIQILTGNGDGTFSNGPATTADCASFTVGDFNQDGKPDIACEDNGVTILLNNGDGSFRTGVTVPIGYGSVPVVADFNGDGILDIASTTGVQDPDGAQDDGSISIYLGDGDGSFSLSTTYRVGAGPRTMVVGDFNGDGKADLAVVNSDASYDSTFLGNGDGSFVAAGDLSSGQNAATTLIAADLNGDGATDLITNYTLGLAAYLAQPTMTALATANGLTVVGTGTHMVTADYPGNGPYAPSVSDPAGLTALSDPTPILTVLSLTASPSSSAVYGQPVTLTATLSPSSGQGTSTDGETIRFFSGQFALGSAPLQGGKATLQLGTLPVGMDTLTASYGGDQIFVGSTSGVREFSVGGTTPATSTSLTVTAGGQPVTTVAAGTAVTFTASVLVNGTPVLSAGTFNFCDATVNYCTDVKVLGTAQITSAGTATFKFVPPIGTHSFKAYFLPTASYGGSASAPAPLAVSGQFATTASLTTSGDGSDYTLTTTITGYGNTAGQLSPTGTVTFTGLSNQTSGPLSAILEPGASAISMALPVQVPAIALPSSLAAADFNGDGILDLAVSNDGDNPMTVVLGNGDGTFRPGVNPAIPGGAIVAGDVNRDGIEDLVVAGGYAPLAVLLGVGDGTFTVLTDPSISNAFSPIMADFNGDGILDLIVTTGQDQILGATPTVQVLLGQGDGTFLPGQTISITTGTTVDADVVIMGDFNGDGKPDLFIGGAGPTSLFLGKGDGSFSQTTFTLPAGFAISTAADFNNDGKTDLIGVQVGAQNSDTLAVSLSNGDGTFSLVSSSIPIGPFSPTPLVGDFNHDGIADVATAPSNGTSNIVFLGRGDGSFTQSPATFSSALYNPIVADVNHDGLVDIVVPGFPSANTVSVFLTELTQPARATISGITLQGVNNETVTAVYPGDTNYLGSTSNPATLTSQLLPAALGINASPAGASTYGQPVTVTTALRPYITGTHSSDGETVTITQAGNTFGTAVLSGGVASLTVSTLPVGSYYLIANYPGDNYLAAASSTRLLYKVSQATPAITFAVANHTYGDAPFAVAASSNSSGAISYTVVSGPATISGSIVTLTGTGTVTLQASEAATEDYLAGTQQISFSVEPVTGTKTQAINFTVPASPVNYGVAPIPLVASATSGLPVTFRIVSGPGTLSGNVISITGAGSVVVAAGQAGNAAYPPAQEVSHTIAVDRIEPAAFNLTTTPYPAVPGSALTFTAIVSSPVSTPTGTIEFQDNLIEFGAAVLTNGVARFTLPTITAGSHSFSAIYTGDANFELSSSTTITETAQNFTLASLGGGDSPSQTVSAGGTASYTLSVSPLAGAGFADAVTFAATGLPAGAVASFTPQTIAAGAGSTNVTLTVKTSSQTAFGKSDDRRNKMLAAVGFVCFLLPLVRHRKVAGVWFTLAFVVVVATALLGVIVGCGGGSAGSVAGQQPTQTYTISVVATSGSVSQTTTVTLTMN